MQFTVQGKGIEITERLQTYVEKKLGKLDRYLPTITEVRVELSTEQTRSLGDRQVAQVTVRANRTILRAEERSNDIFTSVDMVVDKIKRQIDRYKDKRRAKNRGTMVKVEPIVEEAETEEQEEGQIVRIKRFQMTPMTPDEAIEQMELLGHDFFVFYNMNEGQINVLYRRRDGNYGLLQPEMG